jgi:hypothetical protein
MKWFQLLEGRHSRHSLFPQLRYADVEEPRAKLNALLLCELGERSRKGLDVMDEIEYFIVAAVESVGVNLDEVAAGMLKIE